MADKKPEEFFSKRPPAQSKCQQFSQFLYNPSTHEVLGRTFKSWFKITVFYIILYCFLAGFFAGLLMVFFQTLNVHQPTWIMDASLIGTNPGMGYRPANPDQDNMVISYDSSKDESVKRWEDAVDSYLNPYYDNANGDYVDCDYGIEAPKDKPCRFIVNLQQCTPQNSYGFKENKPCIFLKLNKIFGWTPVSYTEEAIRENKMEMPEELKTAILNLNNTQKINNNVWVSCAASSDSDVSMNVTMNYDGHIGFPNYYFPYQNQPGYRSPFVVIQLNQLPKGVLVRVSCRLWAENIVTDRQRRLGMTNLEVLSN